MTWRILLVEDNPADAALLARYLAREDDAYEISIAHSGEEGLELVRSLRPDVVLLDYDLPDLDGLEFLDGLRGAADERTVPVVLAITGQSDPRVAAELIRRGAFDYLSKSGLSAEAVRLAVRQAVSTRALREDLERRTREREESRSELVASLERASYLASVSELLTRSLDVGAVLDTVAQLAVPYLADACFVDVLEAGTLTRRTVELSEPLRARLAEPLPRRAPLPEAGEGVGRVLRSGQPQVYGRSWLHAVARWDADVEALVRAEAIVSLIVVPLRFGEQPLGAITFAAARQHEPQAQGVAEEVARRASAALANARAFEAQRAATEASEAARRRLNTVARISAVFARSLDWRETMTALAELLVPAFCDHATLVVDDGGPRIAASRSADERVQAAVDRLTAAFPPGLGADAGIGATLRTGVAQFHGDAAYLPSLFADPRQAALTASLGLSTSISVPIVSTDGQVLGAMALAGTAPRRFTLDDLAVAEDLGRRAGMYLANARLFEREREIARTLQTSLLPAELPAVAGVEFAARVIAGGEGVEVGGDWYDVVPLRHGRVAFAIGDVAGRGLLAAATMGQLRSSLRAYVLEGLEPSDALARLNAFVLSQERMQFATVGLGVLDVASGVLRFASAGHLPPLLIAAAAGAPVLLQTASSLPVGLIADTLYEQSEHRLAPGDVLALYTDGLVESRTRAIDDGLTALVALARDEVGPPEALVAKLLERLGSDAGDDVTVLALRYAADRRDVGRGETPALGMTFPALPPSAPAVRRRLGAYLAEIGLVPERVADAQLAAGEAVANAIEHAYAGAHEHGLFSLRAFVAEPGIVIEVLDHGVWRGRGGGAAALLAERGRGLTLMHALSDDVTLEHDDAGTRIRLVFALAPAPALSA